MGLVTFMWHDFKDRGADESLNRLPCCGQSGNYNVAAGLKYNGRNLPSGIMGRWVRHPPSLSAKKALHRRRKVFEPQQMEICTFLNSCWENVVFSARKVRFRLVWRKKRAFVCCGYFSTCYPTFKNQIVLFFTLVPSPTTITPPHPFPAIFKSICCYDLALYRLWTFSGMFFSPSSASGLPCMMKGHYFKPPLKHVLLLFRKSNWRQRKQAHFPLMTKKVLVAQTWGFDNPTHPL